MYIEDVFIYIGRHKCLILKKNLDFKVSIIQNPEPQSSLYYRNNIKPN